MTWMLKFTINVAHVLKMSEIIYFIEEIFNQKVHFVAGTSLKCDFTIVTTIQYNRKGQITKKTKVSRVENVNSCYDGEVLSFKSKKLKNKRRGQKKIIINYHYSVMMILNKEVKL